MRDLITALGLVLVIEGLLYAVNPAGLKQLLTIVHDIPDETLRFAGAGAIVLGFLIVWAARGGII
ncbi:MAG: DUF2065 domain-containing protein [Hyphomicrobiales bacterium]